MCNQFVPEVWLDEANTPDEGKKCNGVASSKEIEAPLEA